MSESKNEHIYRTRRQMLTNNFLGGIAWGIGVTIGLTVFFGVLAFIASNVNFVPIVGNFVSDIINHILTSSNQLPR